MFKKAKHLKESANKKRINVLLSVLLVICLVFVGTVLGKYIIDKTIGEKIKLNIAGTPKGNVLIGDGGFGYPEEYNEDYEFVPTAGFAYQLKMLTEANSKTLGDVTKIVFGIELPDGIDKTAEATKIDVSHGTNGNIYAYYDSSVDQSTVYVVPEKLPKDGISYPMMAHENAAAMFAGLYNLEAIEGLENVFLGNITDANNMFLDCRALTAVDLSHWTAENLTDMRYMFAYCMSIKSLDLTSFNTVSVTNMNSAFWKCEALETIELDKEKFVTDKVLDMGDMFGNCYKLQSIDVSGFNTEKVQNMSGMFSWCQSFKTLDVSGFNTSSVDTIYGMFQGCSSLETIDVSNFDIAKVTDLHDMFLNCSALKSLDLSNWDTSGVTTMRRMFQNCSSLEKLDLSTFKTGNVTDMSELFYGCSSLNNLDLSGWDTAQVTRMNSMFEYCNSYDFNELNLSSFNTSNVVTMQRMFAYCNYLETIYVSNAWSTEKVVNIEQNDDGYIDEFEGAENDLFTDCWALVGGQGTSYYDISNEDSENYNNKKYAVIDKAQELQGDGSYGEKGYLTLYEAYTLAAGMDFSTAFNTLQLENMDATTITFGSYNKLKQSGELGDLDWNDETVRYEIVDDKGQGTIRAYLITDDEGYSYIYVVSKDSSVIFANQDCSYMFDTMLSFVSLTNIWGLDDVDTRNTTNMSNMFAFNLELSDLDVSGFDTSKVTDMSAMFGGCVNLSWLDGISNFDTSNVTNMNGMFAQCPVYSLDVSNFDTAKVTNMGSMFASCTNLYELDLSGFDTANVTNMASMFDDCTSLETIYAGEGWNTDKVTQHTLMFDNCTVLVGGQGTAFDSNYIDKTYALIDAAREPNGAKGYFTDADYGTKSKILLSGNEFNASIAALLNANPDVTKVQFSSVNDIYDFSTIFGFDSWDDTAWRTNAAAVLDVARSGNISAFVVGDTVYILAKEVDYGERGGVIYANVDSANMFRHNVGEETGYIPSGRLTAIDGLYFVDTVNTTDMSYMFHGSSNVATVDLASFNTANVTNMEYMFYGCNSIGGLSLSGFDTGKVTDMSYMFYDCDAITALKLSSWDVRNVTNMNSMFYDCDKLNTLNLTGWDTKYVTDMTAMFYGDSKLTTIYVDESWKTGRVDASKDMFGGCTAIVGGQGTTFDEDYTDKEYAVIDRLVSGGAKGYLTHEEAYTLVSGPVFNDILYQKDKTAIYKIIFGTFDQYKNELNITWESMEDETGLSYFDQEKEGNIRLHIVDGTRITEEYGTLEKIYYILSKDSSKIIANEDCSIMFLNDWTYTYRDTGYLEEIVGLELIDTRYVTDMSYMFDDCNVTTLNFSNLVTSNVTNMSGMFYECAYLTSLDLSGFDTSNVTNMSYMFDTCSALETIDVSKFVTGKVTDMSHMFNGMSSLTALNVSSFDTSRVTDMSHMFSDLYNLGELDISNFSTVGYPYIDGMFNSSENLTTIYASELWEPDKVRTDEYGWDVFAGSTMLVGGEGSTWADTAGADSDNDYKFARIDTKVSAGVPGLFTDKNAPPAGDFTLMTGTNFNSVVADLITDSSATKLQFGSWAEYGKTNGFEWQYGTDVGETTNTIKAFEKDGTVYILSAGNMYANADSSYMFKHSYGSDTGYIPQGALTAINGLDKVNTSNVTNMSHMFEYCTSLAALDVTSFNTEKVTDMSYMFRDCASLTTLDVSGLETNNVENMQEMFRYINSVKTLDISSFNTANVKNMQGMFQDSGNLTSITGLNSTGFNTSIVTNMSWMFKGCSALTSLDLSGFDTGSVTTMERMFGSYKGNTLDVSNFDTSSVTTMHYMFDACSNITTLDLSNWDTSAVTGNGMQGMFNLCENLAQIDGLTGFDTSKATTMREMFAHCAATSLDLSSFDTSNVTDMVSMFYNCEELTTIYVDELWNTDEVTISDYMFYRCYDLVGGAGTTWSSSYIRKERAVIDGGESNPGYLTGPSATLTTGSAFNTAINGLFSESVTKLQFGTYNAFADKVGEWNSSTTYVDVDNDGDGSPDGLIRVFTPTGSDTVYVLSKGISEIYANPSCYIMFAGRVSSTDNTILSNLKEIKGLNELNTSKTTDMSFMFNYCQGLTSLDLSNFDTRNVTTLRAMFQQCVNLTNLNVSSFNTSKVTNMRYVFSNCSRLTSLNISNFNTSIVTDMTAMFQSCSGLTTLDVSKFDTSSVTNMEALFRNCSGLTTLDVSSFDTSDVTNMVHMFRDLSITTLDISNFDTSSLTNTSNMFNGSSELKTIYVSDLWNMDTVTTSPTMFYACNALIGGEGTPFDSTKTDKTYACADKAITNGTKGYLTDKNSALLTTGSAFNEAIRDRFSSSVTKIQFGTYNDIAASNTTLANAWNASTTYVDVAKAGSVRVFTSGDTVYVLSIGDSVIYANPDSSCMFSGYFNSGSGSTFYSIYYSLKEINGLSTVNTSKVTAMNKMFEYCSKLTELDVSGFDTGNVTNMQAMFSGLMSVTELDVSNFNTAKVTNMLGMFHNCPKLVVLDLSSFDTSRVTNMMTMFRYNSALKTIYVSELWSADIVTNSPEMFYGCTSLVGGAGTTLAKVQASGVTEGNSYTATYAVIDRGTANPGYLTLKPENVPTGNFTLADGSTFRQTVSDLNENATKIQFGAWSEFGTANGFVWNNGVDVSDGSSGEVKAFSKDSTVYILSGGKIFANASCESMFQNLLVTEIAGFETVDTSNVTSMYCMFQFCENLTSVNLTNLNTSNVTDMGYMFTGCSALKTLDLSSFDTSNVEYMDMMFYLCSNLTTIYAGDKWTTASYNGMMFQDCSSIQGGAGTIYSADHVDGEYARIDTASTPGYFTDPAQKANASALSLDSAAETEADSTVEAILPEAQTKEESESESEPDADDPDTEE